MVDFASADVEDIIVIVPCLAKLQGVDKQLAVYSASDTERWMPESGKTPGRTAFQRDRARVLHSSGLRRLGAKTQVLGPGTDDFVRTRLTHSLEVAQVGRELGKSLGCDPDVVDTACLAHDLGHPPFGHNGEGALDLVAMNIGGFEGNAQTLRILTRLEPKVLGDAGQPLGLNLTRATLDAATKYPWATGEGPVDAEGQTTAKFGVYADDMPVFDWLRLGAPPLTKCLEAQVMDLSDDIAYCVHDVEDAIVSMRLDPAVVGTSAGRDKVLNQVRDWYDPDVSDEELDRALTTLLELPYWVGDYRGNHSDLAHLKDLTSQLIGRFCTDAARATWDTYGRGPHARYAASIVVPDHTEAEIAVLKGIAAAYVMVPREDEPVYQRQRTILAELVELIYERGPSALEPHFTAFWQTAADDDARLRVVIDQVASLTDLSATQWHARLAGGFDRGHEGLD